MQFRSFFLAATAAAITTAASIGNTPQSFVGVTAGSNFNITWFGGSGQISILLKTGEANALTTVSTITSGLSGVTGFYVWAIPATLPVAFYAFEIDDSTGVPNYSIRFQITGGPSSTSSLTSSISSSASSSSGSSQTGSTSTTSLSSSSTSSGAVSSTSSGSSSSSTGSPTTTSGSSTGASRTSASASSTSTTPALNSSATGIASPLALVLLAFTAFMTLN